MMVATSLGIDHASGRVRMDGAHAGPTVARLRLGAQLRRLREAADVTRGEAATVVRGSAPKISRLELGRTGFKPRDLTDLLDRYGVRDEAERATLLALARQANAAGWWAVYRDVVRDWFEHYLGLEHAASIIRCYEVQFIPGLLRTREYARAVVRLDHQAGPEEVEQRVSLRVRRQQILYQYQPPHLWADIDEAALRRPVG